MRTNLFLSLFCCLILSACGGETNPDETSVGENDTGMGGSNTITLTWSAPVENVDFSCTDDLLGFEIHYGNNSEQYTESTELSVDEASCVDSSNVTACGTVQVCSYTLTGLPAATWYLAVSAYDNGGNHSPYSNEIIRVVSN
jgi:hypothetical protein